MKCDPKECVYCKEDNPKVYCTKLGMKIEENAKKYNQFFCGEVKKSEGI